MKLKTFIIEGELKEAPGETIRFTPAYELLIPLGKDATGSFIVDEDGIKWLKEHNFLT